MSSIMTKQFYKQRTDFEQSSLLRDQKLSMPDHVSMHTDIPYRADSKKEHRLDIFFPVDSPTPPLPVIVNIHGGGLLLGSKEFNRYFNARLCELGYLVFSVEYRLIPDCMVYDQFSDISAALKFIHAHIEEYGGDPKQIYGTADSGGAYLLTYIAAMSRNKELAHTARTPQPPIQFQALGLISGMFYTTRFDKIGLFLPAYLYGKHYKKEPFAPFTNPEHPGVAGVLPPCFLVTSQKDYLKHYTLRFEKALSRYHVPHRLLRYPRNPKLTHAFSVFEPELPESTEAIHAMHEFFQKHAADGSKGDSL